MNSAWLKKNWFNILMAALIAILLLVPSAKAWLLRGLMAVGLMQPGIEETMPDTGRPAAMASFSDAAGNITTLDGLRGKVVLINFWATWCPPCIAEMPALNQLYASMQQNPNLVFITVDADGNFERANAFMNKHGYTLPVYSLNGTISEQLFSGSLPTTLVVDKLGQVRFQETGAANYNADKFRNWLQQLADQ